MKPIRIALAIACFSLFSINTLSAQETPATTTLEKRKEKLVTQAQRNSERLGLTAAQKPAFRQISEKYSKLTFALKESTLTRSQKLDSVSKINTAKDAEVKALLTADQFKVYKEIVDQRRQKMAAARSKQLNVPEE